jgi:hypothetical protein
VIQKEGATSSLGKAPVSLAVDEALIDTLELSIP